MMWLLFTVLFLCLAETTFTSSSRDQRNAINQAMRTLFEAPNPLCPGCADYKSEVVDTELAALRVEFVKQQILKKLKLKEVPKVTFPHNKLPIPILTKGMYQNSVQKQIDEAEFQGEDDFFGRTNQVILFPEESSRCHPKVRANYPAACFTFQLPKDIEVEDLAITDLWMYKEKDFLDGDPNVNQTFIYSEILEVNQFDSQQILVIERHITEIEEGWIKLDILETVRKWLEYNNRRHTIQVMCKTCGFTPPWSPVSLKTERSPFLVINTENNRKKRRPKRNINCMPGISDCCREKLYISFVDIGWNDWIIQPRGYEAYFCRGSCSNAASLTLSGSAYSSVVRKLIRGGKKVELVPCCTATHLSSIQLIYMDNNETITQKTLPNMVVDACGCMILTPRPAPFLPVMQGIADNARTENNAPIQSGSPSLNSFYARYVLLRVRPVVAGQGVKSMRFGLTFEVNFFEIKIYHWKRIKGDNVLKTNVLSIYK